MSDANHLCMESLQDRSGLLEIELADHWNNAATARFKVTFRNYPAYRNIDELYRVELWERRKQMAHADATGWTLIVPDSPWLREFTNEPVLDFFNPGIVHYLIVTENDVIEVLSNEEPKVERLDRQM